MPYMFLIFFQKFVYNKILGNMLLKIHIFLLLQLVIIAFESEKYELETIFKMNILNFFKTFLFKM